MSDNRFLSIFLAETNEIIDNLEEAIISLEENPEDSDIINLIFRGAHTLKGSAGLIGLTSVKEFTHTLEDLLEEIRKGSIKVSEIVISLILQSIDIIKEMVSNLTDGKKAEENVQYKETQEKLTQLIRQKNEPKSSNNMPNPSSTLQPLSLNSKRYYIHLKYEKEIFSTGIDPLMFIDDLSQLGTVVAIEAKSTELPELEALEPEQFFLEWEILYQTEKPLEEIRDIFVFVADDSTIEIVDNLQEVSTNTALINKKVYNLSVLNFFQELTITVSTNTIPVLPVPPQADDDSNEKDLEGKTDDTLSKKKNHEKVFLRVHSEKLDNLLNTVSEMVIAQAQLSRIATLVRGSGSDECLGIADTIQKLSNQLQEQTIGLRMVQLGPTFSQFKRLVRDASTSLGKKAKLEISGSETELDKSMIEKIHDPLTHLIRNAIDHGIESPDIRLKNGKSEIGSIHLDAFVEGGNVIISISDDGAGINKKKLFDKAVSKNIIDSQTILSESETLALILEPGLSTADQISELSGRGVGMDAVSTNIKELNGSLQISSTEGEGTNIRLLLPLTLAILDGMLIKVGNSIYILPTISIEETFRPEKGSFSTVKGEGEVVNFRGEYITLFRLYEVFHVDDAIHEIEEALLVVVSHGGKKIALVVDAIIGQQQVVMKSLKKNYENVDGISSATILGDGRVALILDIADLMRFALSNKNVQKAQ